MVIKTNSSQILCPEYEAEGEKKRCRHFAEDRSCGLLAHPVCEEWLRRNSGKPIPNPMSAAFVEANPDYVSAVADELYFRPGWKAKMLDRLTSFPVTDASPDEPTAPLSPPPTPQAVTAPVAADDDRQLKVDGLPSEIEVASFRALGVEVCITSEAIGEFWLVPNYTDANRKEITPEHLLTLCRLIAAFPGCRVSQFTKTFVEA
jgi:hypothetical protein